MLQSRLKRRRCMLHHMKCKNFVLNNRLLQQASCKPSRWSLCSLCLSSRSLSFSLLSLSLLFLSLSRSVLRISVLRISVLRISVPVSGPQDVTVHRFGLKIENPWVLAFWVLSGTKLCPRHPPGQEFKNRRLLALGPRGPTMVDLA